MHDQEYSGEHLVRGYGGDYASIKIALVDHKDECVRIKAAEIAPLMLAMQFVARETGVATDPLIAVLRWADVERVIRYAISMGRLMSTGEHDAAFAEEVTRDLFAAAATVPA